LVLRLDYSVLGERRTVGVERRRRAVTRLSFEQLESRLAMAGVVIYEFLRFHIARRIGDRR
jgi:hypothetical protein